ncbi:hypothetical protein D3C81_1649130 [compost metagenome]
MFVVNARRHTAQAQRVFFIIKRITALTGLGEIFFQMHRRDQRGVGIRVQAFAVQQAGNLFFAELRQERFPRARGVHRQFAADRGRHSHQLCALYLINDNRLMVAVIQHRQVHCFTGIFHQLAQYRVDDR